MSVQVDWDDNKIDLTIGPFALQYRAAVVYLTGWIENRLINCIKGNHRRIVAYEKKQKRRGIIELDSDGDEVFNEVDSDSDPYDSDDFTEVCFCVCVCVCVFS
jgi:hypothetical protein